MNRSLFFMFAPIVLAFGLVFAVIFDLKNPDIKRESCQYVGRGLTVQRFKQHAKLLYENSGKTTDDIAMVCKQQGQVVVNERLGFPVNPGQTIRLVSHRYKLLSTRYRLEVPVINPT